MTGTPGLSDTKVEYRRLGKSGLTVSVPILGAMSFGSPKWLNWVLDEERALPLLKLAYDKGINTWDTADVYSNGESERIIGKALKKYDIPRERIVILTKCYAPIRADEPSFHDSNLAEIKKSKDFTNQYGLSRSAIFTAVNASLKRLDTDYIDLFQIHRFDSAVPIEETMLALHDLVRAGKIRYIGASTMFAYQFVMMQACAEKNGWTKFISMQNHYSLLYREEEREMNKFCNVTGVGIIPWSPLARGFLARPVEDSGKTSRSSGQNAFKKGYEVVDNKIIGRVEELAKKKGWKMSQVALAWINARCCSPIIGFSNEARMDEACAARDMKLTEEEENYLEELYVPKEVD